VTKTNAELREEDDRIVQEAGRKSRAYGAMLQVASELGWPQENSACLRVVDRLAVAEEAYNDGPRNHRLMAGDQYRWLWGIRRDGTVIAPLEGGRSIPPDKVLNYTPLGTRWYYWDTQTLTPITREEALRLALERRESLNLKRAHDVRNKGG
jgi:hypothetical protein